MLNPIHALRSVYPACRAAHTSPLWVRRFSVSPDKPHAYLTPFLSSPSLEFAGDTESLRGVMCLVMDRPEVKNALSSRMVNVGFPSLFVVFCCRIEADDR
jgi:hypothetical protein